MLNLTLKFSVYCAFLLFLGCGEPPENGPDLPALHRTDSLSEARIDSAWAAIRSNCDSLIMKKAKVLADSLLIDSNFLVRYFSNSKPFRDEDKKVERVVRQLQADCDSSLLKETYRIARQQKRSRPKPRKAVKA